MGKSAGAGQDLQPVELWEEGQLGWWGWPWQVQPGKPGPLPPEGPCANPASAQLIFIQPPLGAEKRS